MLFDLPKRTGAIFALAALSICGAASHAQVVVGEHVNAELVAETEALVRGQENWLALRLEHQENWHTYWKNPGDAGKPTEITWHLPAGVSAGDIHWPAPERFELPADLVDFGYTGEVFLPVPLQVAADYQAESLAISAEASWLECEEICIPGGASLNLSLPVIAQDPAALDPRWAKGFAEARAALPREDVSFRSMFSVAEGQLHLLVQATEAIFADAADIRFIPDAHRVLDYNAEQNISHQLSSLQLSQDAHPRALREPLQRVGGILLVEDETGRQRSYAVEAVPEGVSMAALDGLPPLNGDPLAGNGLSLPTAFLFAMLGGIILNLMPCVFPVLSLKALSLAAGGGLPPREQRLHGLAYGGGVILAFLMLAAALLALQAGGAARGWGFHLQSPWFVAALAYLFFVLGLSLSGLLTLGTGIMGLGSELSEREGYAGSFFTGVLAAVVASPCTAPFMGVALAVALAQPAPIALAIFAALGFGMALPFLLLSFAPPLAALLPKPGRWMDTFKQLLAFPLYATVVWLLWVLGRQTSIDAMAAVIAGCVLLAFATWLHQYRLKASGLRRYASLFAVALCVLASLAVLGSPLLQVQARRDAASMAAAEGYELYSAARLDELRREGQAVFVNMTASWCITCLVNERLALSSDAVAEAMAAKEVIYLKGDWTNNDPEITEVLRRYGTSGVPLYLLYPASPSAPAEVLPQILTEDIILAALEGL